MVDGAAGRAAEGRHPRNHSVIDSRFDFDYYRPLPDTRILWGGGITIRRSDPPELRHDDAEQAADRLSAARGRAGRERLVRPHGLSASHSMPQLGEVSPGVWYAMGFGGHGMGTTTMTGELVAAAIAEGDDRYKLFAPFGLDWTGGAVGLLRRRRSIAGTGSGTG